MGGIARSPVVSWRCITWGCLAWTIDVRTISLPLIRDTRNVLICPIGRHITIIVLEVVDSPCSKRCSIKILMTDLGWISSACFGASTAVNPNFEAKCVNLIRNTDYSWREFRGIGDDLTSNVIAARFDGPAIINWDLSVQARRWSWSEWTTYY